MINGRWVEFEDLIARALERGKHSDPSSQNLLPNIQGRKGHEIGEPAPSPDRNTIEPDLLNKVPPMGCRKNPPSKYEGTLVIDQARYQTHSKAITASPFPQNGASANVPRKNQNGTVIRAPKITVEGIGLYNDPEPN